MFNAKSVGKFIGSFARSTQNVVVDTYHDVAKGSKDLVAGVKAGYNDEPAPAKKAPAKPKAKRAYTRRATA